MSKYTMKVWHVRWGWHGNYVIHSGPEPEAPAGGIPPPPPPPVRLGITPEYGWWRPTRPWVERVVRREIEKHRGRTEPEVIEIDV